MKLKISQEDYQGIANTVKAQLKKLPGYELAQADNLLLGPEFLANPLRVSTPKTSVVFSDAEKNYLKELRAQIKREELDAKAKLRQSIRTSPPKTSEQKNELKLAREKIENDATAKFEQLDSIVLFGQLLFSQSGCLHFLGKIQCEEGSVLFEEIKQLKHIVEAGSIDADTFSKKDVLTQRKEFNQKMRSILSSLTQSSLGKEEKQKIERDLYKAQGFYFQLNDLNFKYANAPSRCYSTFIKRIEQFGSIVALAATFTAIGATALSFIPAAAPIALPIATAASAIALCIGMPIALKKLGTMIYNAIRYNAAPTKAEIFNAAALGICLLFAGTGGVVHGAINASILGRFAFLATKAIKAGKNLGQASLGTLGQIAQKNQKEKVHAFFKAKKEFNSQEVEMENLANSSVPDAGGSVPST